MIKVYYRLSNQQAAINKKKITNANKKNCLNNCIKIFGKENITVIGDNLNKEHTEWLDELKIEFKEVKNGNGSDTFRDALNLAIKENEDEDIVYLLEDDFLHKEGSSELIEEALENINCYVTLYDHPDKYFIEAYRNLQSRVMVTPNCHWRSTPSTTNTFACRYSG